MNLKTHLDRAEQALDRGQPDFAMELCDQVLDFAPGEARAADLLTRAALADDSSGLFGKFGAGTSGLAARFSRLTRNADAEARQLRRAFVKSPSNHAVGEQWADALERAGYAGAALAVFGVLAEVHAGCAKRAGALAAAHGDIDIALDYYQKALEVAPRDTEAMRARKNLAAEQALKTKRYEGAADIALDPSAFLAAARGEDVAESADEGLPETE